MSTPASTPAKPATPAAPASSTPAKPAAPASPASSTPAQPAAPASEAPVVLEPYVPAAPVNRTPDSILGALHLTVVELNEAIHGEAGAQVKTLKQRQGTIATIVRKGVAIISELMVALAKGMEVAGNLILGADAVFALLEVVLETLDAMVYAVGGTVAYLSGAKEGGAADLSALDSLRAPLAEAKAFLGESGLVADLMPSPSAIGGIRKELAVLLGSRVDLKLKTTGTLGALEAAIALPGAPLTPASPGAQPPASPAPVSPGAPSSPAKSGPQRP